MVKKRNGFTLVELLAVILILGILGLIAVPSINGIMKNSKKDTYVETALAFIHGVRQTAKLGRKYSPPDPGSALIVKTNTVELERGGRKSSFGKSYDLEYSYVIIYNYGSSNKNQYAYYIYLKDTDGNGTSEPVLESSLSRSSIITKQTTANQNMKFSALKANRGTSSSNFSIKSPTNPNGNVNISSYKVYE